MHGVTILQATLIPLETIMFRQVVIICIFVACVGAYPEKPTQVAYPNRSQDIQGGNEADIRGFPYQLSLQVSGSPVCGACIISKTYALTAAHCTERNSAKMLTVRAGSPRTDKGGHLHQVKEIIEHEKYSDLDYDIAILKVDPPFVFTEFVKALAIAKVAPAVGVSCAVSGWGYTSYKHRTPSTKLMEVIVFTSDHAKCVAAYEKHTTHVTDRMLCAMVPGGGKDACSGDSGGPLEANHELVGIVSWGEDCALPKFPGVYTNVAVFRDFIKKHTGI